MGGRSERGRRDGVPVLGFLRRKSPAVLLLVAGALILAIFIPFGVVWPIIAVTSPPTSLKSQARAACHRAIRAKADGVGAVSFAREVATEFGDNTWLVTGTAVRAGRGATVRRRYRCTYTVQGLLDARFTTAAR